jgi:hypothetical protein
MFLGPAQKERDYADQSAERISQLGGMPNAAPRKVLSRIHSEYVEGETPLETGTHPDPDIILHSYKVAGTTDNLPRFVMVPGCSGPESEPPTALEVCLNA